MKISELMEDPNFIAFQAHCWFAFSCMAVGVHFHVGRLVMAIVLVALAAVKEFWYDIRYETTPPQTYADSLQDFVGYCTGIGLGALL